MRRTPIRTTATFVAAAAIALGLVACGADETPDDDTGAEAPADAADGDTTDPDGGATDDDTVAAAFFQFAPEELTVAAGTTVTFVNEDSVRHTFTSGESGEADGTFDLETVAEGDTAEFTFDEAGTYPYFCEVHANMTGTITVE